MGISINHKIIFVGPARTGTHTVEHILHEYFGESYVSFSDLKLRKYNHLMSGDKYFEWGGSHLSIQSIAKIWPGYESDFITYATFRDPLARVESLYSYMSERFGQDVTQGGFERWVAQVFCNSYSPVWKAHGLQTGLIMSELGVPAIHNVFSSARVKDLLKEAIGKDMHSDAVPVLNKSKKKVSVQNMNPAILSNLIGKISDDLAFWENLKGAGGVLRFSLGPE